MNDTAHTEPTFWAAEANEADRRRAELMDQAPCPVRHPAAPIAHDHQCARPAGQLDNINDGEPELRRKWGGRPTTFARSHPGAVEQDFHVR